MTNRKFFEDTLDHFEYLEKEGFLVDDLRFEKIRGLNTLLMHVHDAQLSLKLLSKVSIYEPSGSIEEALLHQAIRRNGIMNYAKCFSESGKNRTKLDAKEIFKENTEFLSLHERAMYLRNKYFAHSEDVGIDQAHIATRESSEEIFMKVLYTLKTPINEIEEFSKLLEFLESKIASKLAKGLIRIESEIGKELRFKGC